MVNYLLGAFVLGAFVDPVLADCFLVRDSATTLTACLLAPALATFFPAFAPAACFPVCPRSSSRAPTSAAIRFFGAIAR